MSHRKTKLVFASIIGAGAVIATSAFGVTAANADPVSPGSAEPRTYDAVGSDTIQDLYNSFGNSATPVSNIASWDAVGTPATIIPKNVLVPSGANAIVRPNGSGDGRAVVSAAWNPDHQTWVKNGATPVTKLSVSIGRSSGRPSTTVAAGAAGDNITSVPLARDAVSVATFGFSANFTTGELEAIFGMPNDPVNSPVASTGVYTQHTGTVTVGDIQRVTGGSADPFLVTGFNAIGNPIRQELHVELPQSASGTRQFFQNALGGTNTTPATAAWITENHEENHANELTTTGAIIPFSAAQYISQVNGFAPNTGVLATGFHLDQVNGVLPYTGTVPSSIPSPASIVISPNTAFFGSTSSAPTPGVGNFTRDVYSVVPSIVIEGTFDAAGLGFPSNAANIAYESGLTTVVTSTLPTSSNITDFGFEQITYSASSTSWLHSPFEN